MPTPEQRASRRQEKQVAADNAARLTPGSGNTWRKKLDAYAADYLFECKTTRKASISLRLKEMLPEERHAQAELKDWVRVLDIQNKRYYMVRDCTWESFWEGDGRKKLDAYEKKYFFERKSARKASFSLRRREMDPAEQEALAGGLEWVLVLDIQDQRYFVMRDYTWNTLRGD